MEVQTMRLEAVQLTAVHPPTAMIPVPLIVAHHNGRHGKKCPAAMREQGNSDYTQQVLSCLLQVVE